MAYLSRVSRRWSGWVGDAFFHFVWWRDLPAAVWFALFGPREAGEDAPSHYSPRVWADICRREEE